MARLGQINRVKHLFYTSTLTIIINALLVFSKLYYCCNVWSNTSEHNLNRIQAVQNFAAHFVSNTRKYDHVSPTLKDLLVSLSATRNSQMLHIPLYKTTTGQRTFYFRTLELWNSLDPALKLKPTLKNFKNCLKKNLC